MSSESDESDHTVSDEDGLYTTVQQGCNGPECDPYRSDTNICLVLNRSI